MAHKLEKICEEITGIKPNDLEPKPPREQIARWISQAKKLSVKGHVFPNRSAPINYRVVETDTEAPMSGIPASPFTVIERQLPDGTTEYAFVWGKHIDPYDSDELARHGQVPEIEWFELGPNCSL